ncbi:serine/threonine-protein kinase [Actinokineospora sp. 24-640]
MSQQSGPVVNQRMIAGRYVVLNELGRGGMGVVWLAEDTTIGRHVAIKELHLPEGVPAAERLVFEERVLREARTAGRLNDPAVVTVYDVVQESGATYIVMELIQSPTLADVVRDRGPLPQSAVAHLAEQLLSALEAAHRAGVVHRDVKPSNIMLSANSRVKLTDFGIAQSVDDPRLTTSGLLIGSPAYLAPEQLRGEAASAASDLWALGAVLFFAVEGYSPFERSNTAATMHAILNEVPYLTRGSGALASVITGLLNGHPQARLTASQVRGLLSHVQTGPHTGPTVMGQMGMGPAGMGPAGMGQTNMYAGAVPTIAAPASQRSRRGGLPWQVALALTLVMALAGVVGGYFLNNAVNAPVEGAVLISSLTYGPNGQIREFTLSDGYCGQGAIQEGSAFSGYTACDKDHDVQVFGHLTINGERDYVSAELTELGKGYCLWLFKSGRVDPAKLPELTPSVLVPSRDAWEAESDADGAARTLVCLLSSKQPGRALGSSHVVEEN